MKKKDLVLDFTSLLDVILIILFVVISSMGQASLEAKEEAQTEMEKNAGMQEELDDIRMALADLQGEYEKMAAGNEELQKQLEELSKENNLYKAGEAGADIDEALLYEILMEKAKKITLICTPYVNPDKPDGNEVEVTVYSGKNGSEQEALDVVTFTHNFNLTREERAVRNAQMQADMYRSLESIVKNDDSELVLVTIEYTYGDKNFSQADLNNIIGAVDDIERNYPVKCYIDKVKQ